MTKFKQKTVPHPQFLRWAEWFSKYSFGTKYIQREKNVLADFLSRPKETILSIFMLRSGEGSSSASALPSKSRRDIPPSISFVKVNRLNGCSIANLDSKYRVIQKTW